MNKTFIVCLVAMFVIQLVLCEEDEHDKQQDPKHTEQGRDKREADPGRYGGGGGHYGGGGYGHHGGGGYGGHGHHHHG